MAEPARRDVDEQAGEEEHRPFISPETVIPEFSAKAILLGAFFGIVFGAATVYLALRAGLTVSASIPIAVLAIAVFKKLGKSTILENNIVQTIGSAGESIAAGVVFTIPAFLFLSGGKDYFNYLQIMILALVGGILGVLFMVPLRRSLIVKEHKSLPYPEGTACADVLVAGEKGGNLARFVFHGMWVAVGYKILNNILALWKEVPILQTTRAEMPPNMTVSSEITPEYLGVGYIIGPKIAGVMVSGSVLAWVAMIPLLTLFIPEEQVKQALLNLNFTEHWIRTHAQAEWYYQAYLKYIGAGAVAMAGLLTLLRTLPTIVAAFRSSFQDIRAARGGRAEMKRTERDIPITWVVAGSLVLVVLIAVLPKIPHGPFPGSLLLSLLVVIFGFFFVTVSSRIVGIIGSSSNPISGMTIATLMATALIFLSVGWGGDAYQAVALAVGSIVCIAAANAGATSQDLKTGYLVGATPVKQQVGLIIGVLASVAVIGLTLMGMHESQYGPIGSDKLPAPQATLMATIIQGTLSQALPWEYIFVGAALAVVVQLCGVSSLAWAVGAYLPISTTFPIFVGGLMRALGDRLRGKKEASEVSSGMLYSTGLVAGGSIAGILIAVLASVMIEVDGKEKSLTRVLGIGHGYQERLGSPWTDLIAVAAFAVLCYLLVRTALRKLDNSSAEPGK
jgi:putative OPT family oligopeptide transporter